MNNYKSCVWLMFVFSICLSALMGCKTVHKTKTIVEGVKSPTALILDKIKQPNYNYTWFFAKAKIEIEDSKNNNTVNAIIKMKNDSIIWISLNALMGIEISRMLITKDTVKMLDKFNKKYYTYDFNYVRKVTNMPTLDFAMLQKIILGTDLNFDEKNASVEQSDSCIKILNIENQIQNIIWVNTLNMTMAKRVLKDKVINQSYEMNYSDYRLLADRLFSYRRKVKLESNKSIYSLNVDYQKVVLEEQQKFNFTVPEKYERIK
jgi:hypothetical protein